MREYKVMRLSYFEGLTQVEIAERLAIPVGTVKSVRRQVRIVGCATSSDPATLVARRYVSDGRSDSLLVSGP